MLPPALRKAAVTLEHSSMSILSEFKAFISKGNVMDLAVGVIIGGAFQGIVTSLVKDIITPAIAPSISARPFPIPRRARGHEERRVRMALDVKPLLEGGILLGEFHQQRRQLPHPRRRGLLSPGKTDERPHGKGQQPVPPPPMRRPPRGDTPAAGYPGLAEKAPGGGLSMGG